jgi:hypothetical protein
MTGHINGCTTLQNSAKLCRMLSAFQSLSEAHLSGINPPKMIFSCPKSSSEYFRYDHIGGEIEKQRNHRDFSATEYRNAFPGTRRRSPKSPK